MRSIATPARRGIGRSPASLRSLGAVAAVAAVGATWLGAAWFDAARTVGVALAADPTATPGAGGDPRGPSEGPGFVGEPLVAIAIVAGVGLLAVVLTLAYVRLTARPRG